MALCIYAVVFLSVLTVIMWAIGHNEAAFFFGFCAFVYLTFVPGCSAKK